MEEKECQEKLAFCQITEHLKEKEKIKIEKKRHRTNGEDPPDFDFEIGSDKIGGEVVHFDLVDEKRKGDNLASQAGRKGNIVKRIQQSLQETEIPPFIWLMGFIQPPREVPQHVENVVNAITTMYKDSIKDSKTYEQTDFYKYGRLFIQKNIEYINILWTDLLYKVNIDEKYHYGGGVMPTPTLKTIEPVEMQAVITGKDKDIPRWKVCCDRKWLLILNVEFTGFFTLTDEVKETRYTHNFDRVWCIEQGAIYELKKLNQ